jgi:dephospho-CoA kinase
VALTGGLASGKSTVATLFEVFGANRLDFDRFAREAVAPGAPCHGPVAELFGPKCLMPDGQIDRAYVGKRAFKDAGLRKLLEGIIHPETWKIMLRRLKEGPPAPATVIEIPLLFEAGLDSLFARVILAFASPDVQLRRLMFRDPKLGKSQAKKMIASQMPILEKLRRATAVINNDGSLSVAIYQAKDLWDALVASPPPASPGA